MESIEAPIWIPTLIRLNPAELDYDSPETMEPTQSRDTIGSFGIS